MQNGKPGYQHCSKRTAVTTRSVHHWGAAHLLSHSAHLNVLGVAGSVGVIMAFGGSSGNNGAQGPAEAGTRQAVRVRRRCSARVALARGGIFRGSDGALAGAVELPLRHDLLGNGAGRSANRCMHQHLCFSDKPAGRN